jgi:hypothetical protein
MMNVSLHPHARMRLAERGATEAEVIETVRRGECFPAKYGRTGFRRNFSFNGVWRGRRYAAKQVEAFAVEEDGWLVITVIVRYY